jgi:hypothetical protein
MSPELYRLLHVTGALMLFLGLGGMLASEPGKGSKIYGMLHGIGWLVMLVCGIGFAHKTQLGWPNWMIAKVGILVLLGALPFLVGTKFDLFAALPPDAQAATTDAARRYARAMC